MLLALFPPFSMAGGCGQPEDGEHALLPAQRASSQRCGRPPNACAGLTGSPCVPWVLHKATKRCSAASAPSWGRAAEHGSEPHAAPELEAARGGEATASCEKSSRWQAALGAVSSLLEAEPSPSVYLCTFHCILRAWQHPADAGDAHSPGPPHPPPTFLL